MSAATRGSSDAHGTGRAAIRSGLCAAGRRAGILPAPMLKGERGSRARPSENRTAPKASFRPRIESWIARQADPRHGRAARWKVSGSRFSSSTRLPLVQQFGQDCLGGRVWKQGSSKPSFILRRSAKTTRHRKSGLRRCSLNASSFPYRYRRARLSDRLKANADLVEKCFKRSPLTFGCNHPGAHRARQSVRDSLRLQPTSSFSKLRIAA